MQLDDSFKEFSYVFYILQGTNFELDSLMNFNMRGAASPYYMTLVVRLPSSGLQQIFQVLVAERRIGILDLTCLISRPQSKGCFVDTFNQFHYFLICWLYLTYHIETETSKKESTPFLRPHSEPESTNYQDRLLGWTRIKSAIPWPSAFSDTKQRFYMVIYSICGRLHASILLLVFWILSMCAYYIRAWLTRFLLLVLYTCLACINFTFGVVLKLLIFFFIWQLNESELQCDWISLYVELQSVLPIGKSQL